MHSINRTAIVVRPKPLFFDWARSLEGGLPESTEVWTSVYLVPAAEDDEPDADTGTEEAQELPRRQGIRHHLRADTLHRGEESMEHDQFVSFLGSW
jgi:hypothetical protein